MFSNTAVVLSHIFLSHKNIHMQLTVWGIFHSMAFCLVAAMAIISHFKAMCTDPGAVPPDAEPVPETLEMKDLTNTKEGSPRMKPKRLCRRCTSFKPDRAHHCR